MDNVQIAKTVAEAEAQEFSVPAYASWVEFAHLVDGYAILKEMGYEDWGDWLQSRRQQFETDGKILQDLLQARVLLFFEARAMRFTWGSQPYRLINYLLTEIARMTGQSYVALTETEIAARLEADGKEFSSMIQKPGDNNGKK